MWFSALTVIVTALAVVPAGAHLLEMPNKIGADAQAYFIMQQIYRGWSLLGAVLIGALILNMAMAGMVRHHGTAFKFALASCGLLAASLVVFFIWTYRANVATANWTVLPDTWQQLRLRWEYSHAANAAIIFAALCCSTVAALAARR